MLTKRTNILFSQEDWQLLTRIAAEKKTSIGNAVRQAIHTAYQLDTTLKQRGEAFDFILQHRPQPSSQKIDYKELINGGRKY